MKYRIELKHIIYTVSAIVIIAVFWGLFVQQNRIRIFKKDQISRNNLISKESIEGPVLDGLKPQIVNIKGTKQTLYLPDKFKISVLATGFDSPQFVKADDKGNLFVTDDKASALWILPAGEVKDPKIVDRNLQGISDLDYYQGAVYIVTNNKIIKYQDVQSDGSYKERQILVDKLPTPRKGFYHSISVNQDRIYISIPANCESCEPKDKSIASIVSYDIKGGDEQLFAKGLYKITDMLSAEDKLIVTDIGRKGIGNGLPKVEINIVESGRDYGWPYCYGMSNIDPKHPEKDDFCKSKAEASKTELPNGMGVASFDLIPEDFYQSWKAHYAFVYAGDITKSIPQGYKIVIKNINKDLAASNFITGWLLEDGTSWGVPKGITFSNGGMIVTDQKNGILYKVNKE